MGVISECMLSELDNWKSFWITYAFIKILYVAVKLT